MAYKRKENGATNRITVNKYKIIVRLIILPITYTRINWKHREIGINLE